MKLLIINNLASGIGDGAIYDFIRSFVKDGDIVTIRSCDGVSKIPEFLQDASSYDVVVASGGDGTVAFVSYQLRNSGIPILPFPAGTANLLSSNLCSPNEPHALAKLVKNGQTLDFDMGEIEVAGQHFGFSLIAGAGYDATIMNSAKHSKKILGPMAYFSAALANHHPQKSQFTISLDGKTIEREGMGVLLVNFSKIQFDITVTHDNQPRDGEFDVVLLKGESAFELIPALIAGLLDRGGDFPDRSHALEIHRAHDVEIIANPAMEVQYDGEILPLTTPFKARILQKAMRLIVSEEGYESFN